MERYVGIRHRVKRTAEGEARPTQICVIDGEQATYYRLADETYELDWVLGRFPIGWRLALQAEDSLNDYPSHHQHWRKLRKKEDSEKLQGTHFLKQDRGKWLILELPQSYDGLCAGDTVAMVLGGSGDRLAFALSRQSEEIAEKFGQSRILRIKSATLKEWRDVLDRDKDQDAFTLAELARDNQGDFIPTTRRDRDLIRLREVWGRRVEAMKARMGAELRLRSHLIGRIFCSEEGKYPEGEIEVLYQGERTNDNIIQALEKEERARNREINQILDNLPVYDEIFKPIKGAGPLIAARIIVAVGSVLRFPTKHKLKAYLGVHVLRGGKYGDRPPHLQFPRRRQGEIANWDDDGRQALYLLADQFNRNPDSEWGRKLRGYKEIFRSKHGQGEAVRVCNSHKRAYRAAEQIFLEHYTPNPVLGYAELVPENGIIENPAEFIQWLDHCLQLIEQLNRDRSNEGLPESDLDEIRKRLEDLPVGTGESLVTIYSNGHIHKMASWRTVTKFVEWLWREWTKLEEAAAQPEAA